MGWAARLNPCSLAGGKPAEAVAQQRLTRVPFWTLCRELARWGWARLRRPA